MVPTQLASRTTGTPNPLPQWLRSTWLLLITVIVACVLPPAVHAEASPFLPLSAYPRPTGDNGWGIHWTPTLFTQSPQVVDYFLAELDQLGIRWVKLMQPDQAKVEHQYLLQQLHQRGILPVLRVYRPYNDPYQHLAALVQNALPLGVYYYELYNEVNIAGFPGGWSDGQLPDLEQVLDVWIPAADEVAAAGGYPALPTLAPGGSVDDMRFLQAMLEGVVARGRTDLLRQTWLPLHNYFLNHPPDYPYDGLRSTQQPLIPAQILGDSCDEGESAQGLAERNPAIQQDSNGFYKFIAYDRIVLGVLGHHLPIISTEGGVVVGSREDTRYPATDDAELADWTVYALRMMAAQRPDYYFAFMPCLLANSAGEGLDPAWEGAAWYRDRTGTVRPVVAAVKQLAAELKAEPMVDATSCAGMLASPATAQMAQISG